MVLIVADRRLLNRQRMLRIGMGPQKNALQEDIGFLYFITVINIIIVSLPLK